jgi:hypothetical protein
VCTWDSVAVCESVEFVCADHGLEYVVPPAATDLLPFCRKSPAAQANHVADQIKRVPTVLRGGEPAKPDNQN